MNGRARGHFRVIQRKVRAEPLVASIRAASAAFKKYEAASDNNGMDATAKAAWNDLTNLFETLRNEEDQGNLASSYMAITTGLIVNGVTAAEQSSMIASRKIDRKHQLITNIGLREVLNKVAHYDTRHSTYRIDGRGAHYLVLGGAYRNKLWVAEALVERICVNASAAIKAIA